MELTTNIPAERPGQGRESRRAGEAATRRPALKIAYGTYALPHQSWEESLPQLARLGYDGVELFCGPEHHGAQVDALTPARRGAVRQLLADLALGTPAVMIAGSLYHADEAARTQMADTVRRVAALAHDLQLGTPPVLAAGLGGRTSDWPAVRGQLADCLRAYGELAEAEDFQLAAEAHCGAAMDRSERIVGLLTEVAHPRVRCHFDIVHTFLAGEDEADAVRAVLPFTAHTHITDACRHADGRIDLRLLGDGELNTVKYLQAMHEGGWRDHITLEVSRMLWGRPDYDPVAAAERSREALLQGFAAAGVPRG